MWSRAGYGVSVVSVLAQGAVSAQDARVDRGQGVAWWWGREGDQRNFVPRLRAWSQCSSNGKSEHVLGCRPSLVCQGVSMGRV